MNIIKIQDVLKKYSLDDYLKLDLSINNIFRSSFINNIFLSEEFSRFTEAFEQFNPEKFEYREDYGLILGNFITNLFKKDAVEEKKEILQKPTSNIIDQSLSSVVVIETPLCSGSGFIINNKGYIITNYHVIENQDNITVKLNNGEKVFANVISLAKSKDLALLKIAVGSIKPIRVGNIKRVRTGDTVYALGAPGGWGDQILEQSVTKGIVSSIRYLEAPYNPLEKIQFIQTDAAINPGNSGGPLINEKGEAIGINNQKIVTRGVEGIGFAISIEEVKKSFSEYLR
jgi:S1-C subfamily serine protease